MQNYLQKTKLSANLKKLFVLLVLLCALTVAILALFNKYSTAKGSEKKPVSLFMTLPRLSSEQGAGDVGMYAEMNNLNYENAKVGENNAKKALKCRNIRVLQTNGRVEEMELEEYVTACVLGEMPLGFESQAIMAQCVAVRTFAVRQSGGKSKHRNADVCTDAGCCQSFILPENKEISEDNLQKLKGAVNATKGIIMVYEDEPIEAVYHASSGAYTLDSEDVWGGRVEYLRSVPSPEGEAELTSVVYGHRVGMSQHGANILAKQGYDFAEILKYYYSGISFDFLGA